MFEGMVVEIIPNNFLLYQNSLGSLVFELSLKNAK